MRTTAAAAAVVAIALLIGSVALVVALRNALTREVRTVAELRADDVVAALESTGRIDTIAGGGEEEFIQVLDPEDDVVAASANLRDAPPVADLGPGDSATMDVPLDEDPFLVVARAAETERGRLTVLVGRSIDDVDESTSALRALLLVGGPLLVLLVAGTTWVLVGRALAPVESIRREVDAISASQLHRRVPEPRGSDEIARLAATMNRMLDRLEASTARQRRFVSDASHELRSPVAVIRQYAEVALAHPHSMTMTELAENVLAEDLRVQNLVDDLLMLARADEAMLSLHARPVDIDDLVLAEATRLRDTTPLRIDTADVSAGRVSGDEAALRRVLRNVGENAARHARDAVAFGVEESNGHVVVTVDDDGPGVAPAERARVFERFVRLDDARGRLDGGSGLGLAIVTELITAHSGAVSLADSPLGGARVEIRLPGAD
ncbi:MAG: sensor histidine kinase [Actinomycetota bacterium]